MSTTAADSGDWPAAADALARGRALITTAVSGPVIIACDHDVDGLASAVLVSRALERLGSSTDIVPVGRGQHVHESSYRDLLAARKAALYVVTDMGSRSEPIGLPAPTLLIDHHDSDTFPPDAVVVSAARRAPVVPTSYLAFELLQPLAAIDDLAWLALLGSQADLGTRAAFGALPQWRAQHRAKDISEAIALLNAARRAAAHDVATALRVLSAAGSPHELVSGTSEDLARLRAARSEVAKETERCTRTSPQIIGGVALIRIRSKAQVHPLVAVRWRTRLAGKIVLVANEDFLPGRVNFVVRSTRDVDLIAWLRSLPLGDVGEDFARGHPAATGGSLSYAQFDRLLAVLHERVSRPSSMTR
jgi:single-stranded DNA-specific DHH superfamily exonuclease